MVPPIQLPCGSCASRRSSPATANRVLGARASSDRKSAMLISRPLRFFMGRFSFRTKAFASQENATAEATGAVARRSWVLRGVDCFSVAEEARTRGFVPPAFAGFAFVAAALLRLRSEEHTSELQSRPHLVCRLLLEKKKNQS